MKASTRYAIAFAIACPALAAWQVPPKSSPPEQGAVARTISGRVVDGLGRPVPGVKVEVYRGPNVPMTVFQTDRDGRYVGTLAPGDSTFLAFAKEGYHGFITTPAPGAEVVFKLKVDWNEVSMLPDLDGDDLDRGVRELLASEEWGDADDNTLGFAIKNQREFRPALRRVIRDAHVGEAARDWLDLLDDPGDRDLFPEVRPYRPKVEVKEVDLVEAFKAAARQRNFFSSSPEPLIVIDFIKLAKELDCALIQCGINRIAMTGITWQFVFRKVGQRWELRSAKEAGRS